MTLRQQEFTQSAIGPGRGIDRPPFARAWSASILPNCYPTDKAPRVGGVTFALSAKAKHPVPKTDRAAHTLVGHEPPLTLSENSRAALKQGSVSWRWLVGAFVTGLCGAGLIGGALMTSCTRWR